MEMIHYMLYFSYTSFEFYLNFLECQCPIEVFLLPFQGSRCRKVQTLCILGKLPGQQTPTHLLFQAFQLNTVKELFIVYP